MVLSYFRTFESTFVHDYTYTYGSISGGSTFEGTSGSISWNKEYLQFHPILATLYFRTSLIARLASYEGSRMYVATYIAL